MLKMMRTSLFAAATLSFATAAQAQSIETGGWYLRGDINHHWSKLRDTEYITYGPPAGTNYFTTTDLKGAFSFGGGVGYQITQYLRTDFTADYWFKSSFRGSTTGDCGSFGPCVTSDESSYRALLLMANAYVDLGTYYGVTPYVGAGIGGARVKWDALRNSYDNVTDVHEGASSWRFAWALMAGASYCLTENLLIDAGYRFTQIQGGRMFEESGYEVGPGFERGFNVHELRAGLRYALGGPSLHCATPVLTSYESVPYEIPYDPPVYK